MRGTELLEKMELVDSAYLIAAEGTPSVKKRRWVKWGTMAACLCLVAAGAARLFALGGDRPVLQWSEGFQPSDYFTYNRNADDTASSNSIADSEIPYAAERFFSDHRVQMEAYGVIPVMPEHPLFDCIARYNEDGSIFSVTFSWHRRGDVYSSLSITAGYQEVNMIRDCILVEVDEEGNVIPPAVTVTERGGVRIVAEGSEHRDKTMTFQNGTGWYQIAGSWGDSYEAMAQLLDWVWEHPVNLDLFTLDQGAEITYSNLEESPEAFEAYLPDFEAFGYIRGENYASWKDGVPYQFEGHYYAGVDESLVKDGSYLDEEGWREIHWCVNRKPDYYDRLECLGDLSGLTEERITDALSEESNFSFLWNGCLIKVYTREAKDAWRIVSALMA